MNWKICAVALMALLATFSSVGLVTAMSSNRDILIDEPGGNTIDYWWTCVGHDGGYVGSGHCNNEIDCVDTCVRSVCAGAGHCHITNNPTC